MNWVLLCALSLFFVLFAIVAVRGFSNSLHSVDDLASHIVPVNIAALQNLLDSAQDEYFARHLSPRDLRWVRRERARVAMEYVSRIASNAAYYMRAGTIAMRSPDPAISSAGREIVNPAFRTRLNALEIWLALSWQIIVPGSPRELRLVQGYQELVNGAVALQGPARAR